MRILVTGADGFVGPHLLNELTGHGHEAMGIGLSDGDLTDEGIRRELLKDHQPDAIIHLAALSGHHQCEVDPVRTRSVNAELPLDLARDFGDVCSNGSLLFVSSGKVYAPSTERLREDAPLDPPDTYAHTKRDAENALLSHANPPRILIARPFNHTGPGQGPGFLCPDLVKRLRDCAPDHQHVEIEVGSLEAVVDLSDVRDIVRGYRLYLEKGNHGSILNFGSGDPVTVGDVVNALGQATDRSITPRVAGAHDRDYSKEARVGNIDQAKSQLGWEPRISLLQSLQDLWGQE